MVGLLVAADERVQALDTVDEALGEQEIQRAIDSGRLALAAAILQPVQQSIGADRLTCGQNQLQDRPAYIGQPRAPKRAGGLGSRQPVGYLA